VRAGIIGILGVLFLSGCAATSTTLSPDLKAMQSRIEDLERQVAQKDQAIEELKYEVKELTYQVEGLDTGAVIEPDLSGASTTKTIKRKTAKTTASKKKGTLRVNVSVKTLQKALGNAGYYKGAIDGKIGRKTQKAIKAFQKDHRLKADGIVGKKTWAELKNYLD